MKVTPHGLNIDYSSRAIAAYDAESDHSYSYRELGAEVRRIAGVLESSTKSLVFCFCRNDIQMLSAYLGASAAGHAMALLDPESALQAALIPIYQPEYIFRSTRSSPADYANYELFDSSGPDIWRRSAPSGEEPINVDLALLVTTSGSTGSAKLVRLSATNLSANAESIRRGLEIEPGDCAITSLPLHYSYGLSVMNSHLLAGATLALTSDSLTSRSFWEVCRRCPCTSFAGVPYSYHLLRRLSLPDEGFPRLTTMTQAGGHLSKDVIDHYFHLMASRSGRFIVMYGQTEATARITILPSWYLPEKLGSVGKAIACGEVSIAGDSSEVIYRGPNVMLGYAQTRADLSRGDERHGVLNTGDSGYLDRDGFLYITGRLNRFAKVCGTRVNLDEVESLLRPYGPAAVIGADGKLVIFCEGSQSDVFLARRDALARDLSLHRQFLDMRALPSLPLKPNGKVDYRILEETVMQC